MSNNIIAFLNLLKNLTQQALETTKLTDIKTTKIIAHILNI